MAVELDVIWLFIIDGGGTKSSGSRNAASKGKGTEDGPGRKRGYEKRARKSDDEEGRGQERAESAAESRRVVRGVRVVRVVSASKSTNVPVLYSTPTVPISKSTDVPTLYSTAVSIPQSTVECVVSRSRGRVQAREVGREFVVEDRLTSARGSASSASSETSSASSGEHRQDSVVRSRIGRFESGSGSGGRGRRNGRRRRRRGSTQPSQGGGETEHGRGRGRGADRVQTGSRTGRRTEEEARVDPSVAEGCRGRAGAEWTHVRELETDQSGWRRVRRRATDGNECGEGRPRGYGWR